MDDTSILYIGTFADFNIVHIATDRASIPDRTVFANFDIANDYGRIGHKGTCGNFRGKRLIISLAHFKTIKNPALGDKAGFDKR